MHSIPLSHLLFELSTYVLFFICLFHARAQGTRNVERIAILITGTVYGLLLETMTIYQLHAYKYGAFLVMFHGEIPLTIGIGWGIILYSVIVITDAFRLSVTAWIASVGLLGLAIDATMDVAAVRIGMWNWYAVNAFDGRYLSPTQDWFGVTLGNYFAWFIVLTSAAAFIRLLKPGAAKNIGGVILRSAGAMFASVAVLGILDALYFSFSNHQWWPIAVELVAAVSCIVYSLIKKRGAPRDLVAITGLPSLVVPMFFHLYFGGVMIWAALQISIIERVEMRSYYLAQMPVLLVMGIALSAGTFFVHKKAVGCGRAFNTSPVDKRHEGSLILN